MEPPSGADPDHPPYEGGAAAVRGGKAGEPGLEPGLFWARTRCVARLHHSPLTSRSPLCRHFEKNFIVFDPSGAACRANTMTVRTDEVALGDLGQQALP